MEEIHVIWDVETDEYKLPKLTDRMLAAAEARLGVKLPESYVELMRVQNGGVPVDQAFPCDIKTDWADDHVPVQQIYGVGEEGILQSPYLIEEWGLPKEIVVFSGDGHMWLAMDYRTVESEPPILFVDADNERIVPIASSFADFLTGLYTADLSEDEEGEIYPGFSTEQALEALAGEDEANWILSFNYFYENTMGQERLIEQKMLELLESPSKQLKNLAAHYIMVYHEKFSFGEQVIQEIYCKMEQDEELKEAIPQLREYIQIVQGRDAQWD